MDIKYTDINWYEILHEHGLSNMYHTKSVYEKYEFLKQFIPICSHEIYEKHIRELKDFLNI